MNDYGRRPIYRVLDHLPHGYKETGRPDQFYARCPGPLHKEQDRHRSLSIRADHGMDGELVLMHCFTGCDTQDVLDAMGLQMGDLFASRLELDSQYRSHAKPVLPFHLRRAMQMLLELDEAA